MICKFSKSLITLSVFGVLAGCQSAPDRELKTGALEKPANQTAEIDALGKNIVEENAQDNVENQAADKQQVETQVANVEVQKPAIEKSVKKVNPNIIEAYVPPRKGTIFTFRNNWASLPPVITYKVDGTIKVGSKKYVKMTAIKGMNEKISSYYDADNFALKGYRDAKDKVVLTYKPVEERYQFPMKPGDSWVTAWKSYDHRKKKQFKGGGVIKAIGFEQIELPSGKFRAMKVKLPKPLGMPKGMTHYIWFAPELGVTVKEQIGNGVMNWTQILEMVKLPNEKVLVTKK